MAGCDKDLERGTIDCDNEKTIYAAPPDNNITPMSPVSLKSTSATISSTGSQVPLKGSKLKLNAISTWRLCCIRRNNPRKPRLNRKPVIRKIDTQILGYPKLATFQDSDENFMIYRRFGYLQSRILLERQDDLRRLELKLDIMDVDDADGKAEGLRSRSKYHADDLHPRCELMAQIEAKWLEYANLLRVAQAMVSMNKPTSYEHQSVWNWLDSSRAVDSPEDRFIRCKEDLITLRSGREHAWLDAMMEHILRWSRWKALNDLFRTQDTKEKSDGSDGVLLYTRARIERLVVSVIMIMILVLLVLPIYVLHLLTDEGLNNNRSNFDCIGVLLVSTLAFSACISLFTRAKRHEILAASAAYCAVLVVFIGNTTIVGLPDKSGSN